MSFKHRQFQIFLIALVCVQFVCPLFCATLGQMICGNIGTELQIEHSVSMTSCCHKTETDPADESNLPFENKAACCLDDLTMILPVGTLNGDSNRILESGLVLSDVQVSSLMSVAQEHLLHFPRPPDLNTTYLNRSISRRGPPYTHS